MTLGQAGLQQVGLKRRLDMDDQTTLRIVDHSLPDDYMGDSVESPTLHRRRDSNGLPVFSPVRQHSRAKYPGEQSVDLTHNFAKFVKKESKDRTNHTKDDCS